MAENRARAGGYLNWTLGEKITTSDLVDMGTMALQNVGFALSQLFRDTVNAEERSGFLGESCLVTVSSGLTMQVAAGVGWYDDEAETDAYEPVYKPIVVPVATTTGLTLGAHDATNPRIDIICIAPDYTDEDTQSRQVIDPGSGSVSSQSVAKKTRCTYALQVVAGTPASTPAAPSTPAGYLKLAECAVPASSGAVTVTDTRPVLQWSEAIKTPPPPDYHQNWIPGTSTELSVGASSPASMELTVAAGEADVLGTRVVQRQSTTAKVALADATNPRIDLVVVRQSGTIETVTGTPAGSPTAPSVPSNAAVLAEVAVAAAATSLASGTITDRRLRQPHTTDLLYGMIKLDASVGAESSNQITVSVQAKTTAGQTYRGTVDVRVELIHGDGTPETAGDYRINSAPSTGSAVSPTNGPAYSYKMGGIMRTSSAGALVFTVTDNVTGSSRGIFAVLTPMNVPGYPVYVSLGFN